MATIAEIVSQGLLAAGIPIVGVSIGNEGDRLTWSIQFDPSATAQQRTQAAGILASVAIDAAGQHAQDQADVKSFVDNMPLPLQATFLTILDQVNVIRSKLSPPLGAITVQQWINAVKTKIDTL